MIVASETYDYEPFNKTEHSMKQIADAIRHKGYGKMFGKLLRKALSI